MGFLDSIWDRFKKQPSIVDMKLDDLNRERISLEQEQHKLDRDGERFHKDEVQLKSEYAEAQTENQKMRLARKIQNTRLRSKAVDAKSAHCHKAAQAVNGIIMIKDNIEYFDHLGVSQVLKNTDLAEMEAYIQQFTVEGTLQQDKLGEMLKTLGTGTDAISESTEDQGLKDLMAELDGESADGVTETGGDLKNVMKDLDGAISKAEQAARQAQTPAAPTPTAREPSTPAKPAAEPNQED
jgi:hypothetical protein